MISSTPGRMSDQSFGDTSKSAIFPVNLDIAGPQHLNVNELKGGEIFPDLYSMRFRIAIAARTRIRTSFTLRGYISSYLVSSINFLWFYLWQV